MKTIKTVEIEPVFCENDIPEIPRKYEQGKVYVNSERNKIALKCLCGCGDLIILPVNVNSHGWQLKIDDTNKLSLIGSILQHSCKAHYIITRNKANFV